MASRRALWLLQQYSSRSCAAQSARARPAAQILLRGFSTSSTREKGDLPTFEPSSSPELDDIFLTIRNKYLLPRHLNKEQRRLVYDEENKGKLEAEEVYIALGSETVRLEHIGRSGDVPSQTASISEAVRLASEPEDCRNLGLVLEGFNAAKHPIGRKQLGEIIRKMILAGTDNIVVRLASRSEKSGLSLGDRELAIRIFVGIFLQNHKAGWDKEVAARTLKTVEQLTQLMGNEEHCGRHVRRGDTREAGVVMAVPLQLSAVLASSDESATPKVETYARRLTASMMDNKLLEGPIIIEKIQHHSERFTLKSRLMEWTVVWTALDTARSVLGSRMPNASFAVEAQNRLRGQLDTFATRLKDLPRASRKARSVEDAAGEEKAGADQEIAALRLWDSVKGS